MNKTALLMPVLLVLAVSAQAQQPPACPQLPASAGLSWEHRAGGGADICRALREDGTEAFGMYIASESPFKPNRRNREEQGAIDGREIHWYRAEIAAQPNVQARETLLELDDGRVAHIWLQAHSDAELAAAFSATRDMRLRPDRGSSQVASGQ